MASQLAVAKMQADEISVKVTSREGAQGGAGRREKERKGKWKCQNSTAGEENKSGESKTVGQYDPDTDFVGLHFENINI